MPPPPIARPHKAPDTPAPAGFLRRLAALVYDGLLLSAVLFAATLIVLPIRGGQAFRPHDPIFSCYLLAVSFAFLGWCWTHGGQTLGMRAWQLRVVADDNSPPNWGRAALRFLMSLVSLGFFGLGYAWILVDRRNRAWHDLASGTRVIREGNSQQVRIRRSKGP